MNKSVCMTIMAILIIFASSLFSQDIHFSQFMREPMFLNPALTGNIGNCIIRAGANYKSQWDKTYVTQSAFIDGRISPAGITGNTNFGIGGSFFSDVAGDGNFKDNYFTFNMAIHKSFNAYRTIWGSLGLAAGLGNISIDYSRFYFDSQWNGFTFDINTPSNENFPGASFSYFDINTGVNLHITDKNKKFNTVIGLSAYHINRPVYSFFTTNIKLQRRYSSYLKTNIFLGLNTLRPAVYYSFQNGAQELITGMNIKYDMNIAKLYYGIWFRVFSEIIPLVGIDYKHLSVMISYDIGITTNNTFEQYKNGLELSIIKVFCYSETKLYDKLTTPCDN